MATDFLTWWGRTLLGLLPARLAGRGRLMQDALVLAPVGTAPGRVALALRRNGRDRPLGPLTIGDPVPQAARAALARPFRARQPRVLRLPADQVLQRDIVLPLAAEPLLHQVVGYEIDRITPFAAEELHWACVLRSRDRANARLHVGLALVPRAALRPLLDALGEAGLAPDAIEAAQGDAAGPAIHIDLRPARPARSPLARTMDRATAALCAALLLAIAATPFILQDRAQARVEARIAALRPAVDAADAARRRLAAAAGVDVVATTRARLGDTLAVLAAITDLLPDGTSLSDLTLRDGRLTLGGESNAAARLIGALSGDPAIRDPDFAAPVTRTGRVDLFSIRAAIGTAAAAPAD